jgi:hypothetical protein
LVAIEQAGESIFIDAIQATHAVFPIGVMPDFTLFEAATGQQFLQKGWIGIEPGQGTVVHRRSILKSLGFCRFVP